MTVGAVGVGPLQSQSLDRKLARLVVEQADSDLPYAAGDLEERELVSRHRASLHRGE